jgi:precorrin-4/cobalt-precorrin-4 C11-methyltransferase
MNNNSSQQGRVYFIGAGPGDAELLTIKAARLIAEADIIIYADSLINPDVLKHTGKDALVYTSADRNLEEITDIIVNAVDAGKTVARLQSGDPAFYGAIREQLDALAARGITGTVIPGVSSLAAVAASLGVELTVPGITQSVIVTRRRGRTPVPAAEDLKELAKHQATMAIFLSVDQIEDIVTDLIAGGYPPETPAAAVCRASFENEVKVTGNLSNIAALTRRAGINRQAVVLVGRALAAGESTEKSRLYDKNFSHGYRRIK